MFRTTSARGISSSKQGHAGAANFHPLAYILSIKREVKDQLASKIRLNSWVSIPILKGTQAKNSLDKLRGR